MNIPWDRIIELLFDMFDRCIPAPEMVAGADEDAHNAACEGVCKERCEYIRKNQDTRRFRASIRRAVRSAGTPFRLRSEAVQTTIDDIKGMNDGELASVCHP